MRDVSGPETADCLLFDWDGTLVDSTAANYRALATALAPYDITLDEDWYRARTGVSTDAMIRLLADAQGKPDVDVARIAAERDALFLSEPSAVRELTAVVDIARAFQGRIPLAVASGGSGPVIRETMRTLGLDRLFDCLVTREDVAAGKPAPDIFLLAAGRLAVRPERCLVYEDSDEGLTAAHRAGMAVIDVRPWRYGPKAPIERTVPLTRAPDHATLPEVTR